MNPELIRWAERLFLIPLSCLVVYRVAPIVPEHPQMALFLVSEVVSVVLLLTQRRGAWSVRSYPLIIALIGTGMGLLVIPEGAQLIPEWVSTMLMFTGATIALMAKLFLGRSFGIVPANRGVKDHGVYRWVRHPMYAGYMLNQLSFLLVYFSPYNVAIYAGAWLAFWLRAVEEEKFLEQDQAYRDYRGRVRYRLIPGIA
jgi:protein-S-isoprenylcysteine O-methyltransferase Ste14